MEGPVRWARSGDASIAFRTLGEGSMDLIFLPGFISHIEVALEETGLRRWFERLTSFGRVILIDRRGSGLSDPLTGPHSLEDEVQDVEAVLDAAGSDRVVLLGYWMGGPLALEFAVRRPERTLALILYASIVKSTRDEEIHWTHTAAEREALFEGQLAVWGEAVNIGVLAPSAAGDERLREWMGRMERLSITPGGVRTVVRNYADMDSRPLLDQVRVPTLVLHRTDDGLVDVRHSRYLAQRIPGARLVELPGADSLPQIGDTEALLGEMEEFLTGGRRQGEPQRALLTVLFSDICEATAQAARMGDGRWRDLLAAHDEVVRKQIASFGGDEVKTIGDAFLVIFDGMPSRAVRCARAIVTAVRDLGVDVRVGLHTGECEILGDDVGGMAVHIAARVSALAQAGEVLVSGTTFGTVVGSGLKWEDRGAHDLKGVPGRWPIFALQG